MRIPCSTLVAPMALCAALSSSLAGEGPAAAKSDLEREYDATVAKLVAARRAIPEGENAADDYARAFDALPPGPGEDLDMFLTCTAISAVPAALREFPGAVDEVRNYREAVTAHLRRAVLRKRCMFDLDWSELGAMLLPHLAKARDLARRAAVYGKLLELEGRSAEAARVYLDIIRMGLHLEQDRMLIPILVGIAVVGIAGPQIEGLLAREPDAETARLVFEGMRDLPRQRFDAARAIDFERMVYGGWMRKEIGDFAEKGRDGIREVLEKTDGAVAIFGGGFGKHKPWRIPEKPDEIRREIDRAFETYDGQMRHLVRLMEKPYHETGRAIANFEKTLMSYWKGQAAEGRFAAALVSCITGIISIVQVRTVRSEVQLRGLEILAAACLAKAERGEYPADLAGLARYFPKGVPADPVAGNPFRYTLAEGLPAVLGEADNPETAKTRPETYHFGLAYRLTLEQHALDAWRAERKRRAAKNSQPDAGLTDPDNVW